MSKLISFIKDEEGQGMVEYGLIIAGVAVVLIALVATFGEKIAAIFNGVNGQLTPTP